MEILQIVPAWSVPSGQYRSLAERPSWRNVRTAGHAPHSRSAVSGSLVLATVTWFEHYNRLAEVQASIHSSLELWKCSLRRNNDCWDDIEDLVEEIRLL